MAQESQGVMGPKRLVLDANILLRAALGVKMLPLIKPMKSPSSFVRLTSVLKKLAGTSPVLPLQEASIRSQGGSC